MAFVPWPWSLERGIVCVAGGDAGGHHVLGPSLSQHLRLTDTVIWELSAKNFLGL